MAFLTVEHLEHHWQSKLILPSLSFSLEAKSFACLVGPSGSGKTTLLRIIAGLEPLQQGRMMLDGRDASTLAPHERRIGMVFQEAALFPHLTVAQNIVFGVAKDKQRERLAELLVHIELEDKADAMPYTLSGGQQQRVALARALAPSPLLLLLDEPFGHLDAQLRLRLREETKALAQREGVTCLMVTHDAEEAMQTADTIILMDEQGRLHQQGTPHDVFHHPVNRYAATALGEMNFVPATSDGQTVSSALGQVQFESQLRGEVVLGIRPQGIELHAPSGACDAMISSVTCTGPEDVLQLQFATGSMLKVRLPHTHHWRIGDEASITIRSDYIALFDAV